MTLNSQINQQTVTQNTSKKHADKVLWNHVLQVISTYSGKIFPNLHFQQYIESNQLTDFSKKSDEGIPQSQQSTIRSNISRTMSSTRRHGEEMTQNHRLTQEAQPDSEELDLYFVSECFFGVCDRYKTSLIDPILSILYNSNTQLKSQDRPMYSIFIYLLCLKLEEMTLSKFRSIVKHAKITLPKLIDFLHFLFDEENVTGLFVPEWEKSFDHSWVKENLVASINNNREAVAQWIINLQERIHGQQLTQKDLPQITIPDPFNLTKLTQKIIPQPIVLDTTFKAKEIPASTYGCDEEVKRILEAYKEGKKESILPENERQKHREEFQKNLKDPLFKNFNERAEKTAMKHQAKNREEMRKKIKEDMEKRKSNIKSVEEVRKILNQPAKVRYNAAALLREDALLKQKQQQEASIIKQYESELRDSSKFYEWQDEMRQRDELEKKLKVQQRKLEMELVDARAKQAKIDQEERNKLDAQRLKEEIEQKLEILQQEREQEAQELKVRAAKLQDKIKISVQKSKFKNKKEKQEIAESTRRQKHKMELILARQLELDRQRKEDIVLQVKAQESIKPIPEQKFDPTEAKGDGLLGEMSYIEMKQRLELQRKQEEELNQQKRDQIERERTKKRQELLEKSEKLSAHRKLTQEESRKRKVERLRQEYKEQAVLQKDRDEKLLDLQKKISEHKEKRRLEREQQKEEERQRLLKAKFMGAAKRDQEIKHWKQQEEGRNREAFQKARNAHIQFESQQKLKEKERTIALQNARKARTKREKAIQQIDKTIRETQQLHEKERVIQNAMLKQNARLRHDFEVEQRMEQHSLRNVLGYGEAPML